MGRLSTLVETWPLERPRTVLLIAALATVLAVVLGAGIELRTSRRELVPSGDPDQARYDALLREFSGPSPVIVALEAADDAPRAVDLVALQQAADAVAAGVGALHEVDLVFHRLDIDWLVDHAFYLVSPTALSSALDQLDELTGGPQEQLELSGIAAFNELLAERVEIATNKGTGITDGGHEQAARLADVLRWEHEWLEQPAEVSAGLPVTLPMVQAMGDTSITNDGYLTNHAHDLLFLFVSPRDGANDLTTESKLVLGIRDAAHEALRRHPGIRVGLTGRPAMSVEEMAAIRRDGPVTSTIAIIGVGLLSALAFRRRRHALLGLVVLAAGVLWALGAVRLELGYLNLITTSLIPILAGVGIDYAVHPLSQYEIERSAGRDQAARRALATTRTPILVSALTTSAAFFCFLLMDFRGFAELGLVAGSGVLLCLLAAIIVLPALLATFGESDASAPDSTARAAFLDRFWRPRLAQLACGAPGLVVTIAVIITLLAAWGARGVKVNTALVDLLPAGSESLHYLQRLTEESSLGAYFNIVLAADLPELAEFERRANASPSVERFDTVLRFLPPNPAAAEASAHRAADLLARIDVESADPSGDVEQAPLGEQAEQTGRAEQAEQANPGRLVASLRRLEVTLADAVEAAFVSGLAELIEPLENARAEAEAAAQLVDAADESSMLAWQSAEEVLLQRAAGWLGQLRNAAAARPPGVDDLPLQIAGRFITRSGRYLGFLYPSGSIFDPPTLTAFNAASRQINNDVVGFPLMFEAMSGRITAGFVRALGAASLVVLLLLLAHLRRLGDTLMVLVPVVVGTIWMLGLMRVFELSFNLANLVAVPLVLGVGIDSGVHLVHRWGAEGPRRIPAVLHETGRGVLIASLTTMVGFGSLGLASHRGMSSLGILLALGVFACLVASLAVLPSVYLLAGRAER